MNKNKIIRIIIGCLCLLTMLRPWFGSYRGVQEISGLIVLYNPLTILACLSILLGILKDCDVLAIIGSMLLIVIEIFYFLTWPLNTITYTIDISFSISASYPAFYIELILVVTLLYLNILNYKKTKSLVSK